MIDTIPEGASRTYRVKVPDGKGGFKSLLGYSFVGLLKTKPDTDPIATLGGSIDPDDATSGLVDLLPSHTAGRGGSRLRLDLEATNGQQVHVQLVELAVQNR